MENLNIIMVNYNGAEDTMRCFDSLIESNKNYFSITIVLVDNNSMVSDTKEIESYVAKNLIENFTVHFIKNAQNVGFAAANNIGLQFLKDNELFSGYIWFLNNDTLISESLLAKMHAHLPTEQQVFYFEMRDFQNIFFNDGLNYMNLWTGQYSETKRRNSKPYICGASIYLKCSDLIPFWNETFFLYFEDVDYSIQLSELQFTFIRLKDAYYKHKISASSSKNPNTALLRLESQIQFMRLHGKSYALFFVLKFFYLLIRMRFTELKVLMRGAKPL